MFRRCFTTVKAVPVLGGYRFKLLLPSVTECWFTFSASDTLGHVQKVIQEEDPLITSVTSGQDKELSLNAALNATGAFQLHINDAPVTIVKGETEMRKIHHTPLLQFIDLIYSKAPTDRVQLDAAINSALKIVGEETISKIEKLNAELYRVQKHLDELEQAKARLEGKIDRRVTLYSLTGLSFLSAQWGFFFYTIYMVDWLGWDLMEPMTYSVGQAGFLACVWYFLRTKSDTSFKSMAERYRQRRLQQFAFKHSLDMDLLLKLQKQKTELSNQQLKLSNRLTKGGPLAD